MRQIDLKPFPKTTILFIAFLLIFGRILAQDPATEPEMCGTDKYHLDRLHSDETYRMAHNYSEEMAAKWLAKNKGVQKDKTANKVVIPVVFHVVYNQDSQATQKLPYERFLQQIEILNRDYNRENADKHKTRSVFDSIAGSANIVFALATKDPSGNPTTGITYTSTNYKGFDYIPTSASYAPLDSLKSTTGGGESPWPTDKYLNIWVARLTFYGNEGLYGIATFPGNMPTSETGGSIPAKPSLQGVSMHFPVVGTNIKSSNGDTVYLGRVATHEMGHYFGLRHVWGDGQSNDCSATDYVDDTPFANSNANFKCTFSLNQCSSESSFWGSVNPPNNVENYMDYSGDLCYNMFSNGQIARMQSFLNTGRKSLWETGENGARTPEQYKAWGYSTAVACPDNCDGTLEIIAQNGTGPYTYYFNNTPQSSNTINSLCSGIYHVKVVDSNNDSITFDMHVAPPNYIKPTYTKKTGTSSCSNCPDGKVSVKITKGLQPITITWQVNPPVENDTLDGLMPGYYTFMVSDRCGKTYTDSVQVKGPVGIEELLSEESVFIYPNPSRNTLNLELTNALQLKELQISDVSGRILEKYYPTHPISEHIFNVANLTSGIYLLTLTDIDGGRKAYRFVKD